METSVADKYLIIKQLHDYIEEEKDRVWEFYKKESTTWRKKYLVKKRKNENYILTRSINLEIRTS
jgi:hypothetical protein